MTEPLTPPRHIVLVGFMGTGKSTVARILAQRGGFEAVDVDAEIVEREGRAIPELFAQFGEDYFRAAETDALRSVMGRAVHQVVATGGGAVLRPENRALMANGGLVVALIATAEQIIARVSQDKGRPLLQGNLEERVHKLLSERRTAYDFAPVRIDTTGLNAEEVAEAIWDAWLTSQNGG
ncbi:shikimate kinase [Paenibacillus xanthanilyticus]|uniref:Shikimate kinase n=1 Tax=Paenibacillus xanthanilyticus TaxID=1783531 RepID=A0ABV8K4K5_9BACL